MWFVFDWQTCMCKYMGHYWKVDHADHDVMAGMELVLYINHRLDLK